MMRTQAERALAFLLLAAFFCIPTAKAVAEEPIHHVPSEVCKNCHQEIYRQWSKSMHSQSTALSDPIHATFYEQVVGWQSSSVDMGGYQDFGMVPPGEDQPTAGVCHARGTNIGLPSYWLIYIVVDDLDASLRKCESLGGKTVVQPKSMAGNRYSVIEDPAGAVCALYEPKK